MAQSAVAALLCGVLLVLPSASATGAPGAATPSVARLEASIRASSLRIHLWSSRFSAASAEAASLGQQLTAQTASLGHLESAAARSRSTLLAAAVDSYTGDAPGAGATLPDTGVAVVVGAEYLTLASDAVGDDLGAYRLKEREVATAVRDIRRERAAAAAAAAAASAARSRALDTARREQASLYVLETRLAVEAARSRKAPATQGGPVDGGLVAVVTSQTSGSPTTSAPASTTTDRPTTTTTTTRSHDSRHPPTTSPPTTSPPSTSPPSTSPPTTAPPVASGGGGGAGGVWYELRMCESGDNYRADTGNGFYGAYQFSQQTWTSLGYPGRPDLEPPAMQDAAAQKLQAEAGWGQWPACAAALGLT